MVTCNSTLLAKKFRPYGLDDYVVLNSSGLLDGIGGSGITRIDGLASGEAFILTVIIADAVLAQFPAKINFFVVDDRREIEQTDIEILDYAAGFENTVERTFQTFRQTRVLAT